MNVKSALFILINLAFVYTQALDITLEKNFEYTDTTHISFNACITNNSSDTIILDIIRENLALPESWETSFCTEYCFPSFVDSTRVSIPANQKLEKFTVDILNRKTPSTGDTVLCQFTFRNITTKDSVVVPFGLTYVNSKPEELLNKPMNASLYSFTKENAVLTFSIITEDFATIQAELIHADKDWDIDLLSIEKDNSDVTKRNVQILKVGKTPALLKVDFKEDNKVCTKLVTLIPQSSNPLIQTMDQKNTFDGPISGYFHVTTYNSRGQIIDERTIEKKHLFQALNMKKYPSGYFIQKTVSPSGITSINQYIH